jgi:hypothetical protein
MLLPWNDDERAWSLCERINASTMLRFDVTSNSQNCNITGPTTKAKL